MAGRRRRGKGEAGYSLYLGSFLFGRAKIPRSGAGLSSSPSHRRGGRLRSLEGRIRHRCQAPSPAAFLYREVPCAGNSLTGYLDRKRDPVTNCSGPSRETPGPLSLSPLSASCGTGKQDSLPKRCFTGGRKRGCVRCYLALSYPFQFETPGSLILFR